MFSVNWSTTLIMYHDKANTTNFTTQCTLGVALFLKYAGTLIVILGLIGNFFSILVFSRKALRSRSCSIYFLALSMSDVHVLVGYTLENLLLHGYGVQLLSSSFMCKFTIFLIYASTDVSNYLLTLAAIDRCVLISNASSRYRFCRQSTARSLIAVVVLLFGSINSHILFGFDVDETGACLPISANYIHFYVRHYDSYIDIVKTVLIPFILIFFCNSFIIFKFTRQRTALIRSASFRRKSRRRQEKDRQLTWFLLSTSILFILLSLPAEINDFIRTRLEQDFQITYSCQLWASTSFFILFQQTNHASHFYVYTLTGPIFRKEFQKLLCVFRRKTSKKEPASHSKRASITVRGTQVEDPDDQQLLHPLKASHSLARVSVKSDVWK